MDWTFEPVAGPFEFTEGPVWHPSEAVVSFSDIPTSRILRYDPASDECTEWATDTNRGNGSALGPDGRLYNCEMGTNGNGHQISRYDRNGERTVLVHEYNGRRLNSPNDLAFDSLGRLWFTDPDYDDQDDLELDHFSVYYLDPAGDPGDAAPDGWEVTRAIDDTTNPNGLVFSKDEGTLYVAESPYGRDTTRELRAYPIDDGGSRDEASDESGDEDKDGDGDGAEDVAVGEYEVLHDFGPHRGIDGMCLTDEGNVVATAGWEESGPGGLLYIFTPEGRVLETHPYPGDRPTNCAFGGEELTTLYASGFDGYLYRAETDRVGYPVPPSS